MVKNTKTAIAQRRYELLKLIDTYGLDACVKASGLTLTAIRRYQYASDDKVIGADKLELLRLRLNNGIQDK